MQKFLPTMGFVLLLTACSEQSVQEHLSSAKQALSQDQFNVAVIELKNAVQLEPKNATVRFLLGQTYLELGQYPQAEKELEKALEFGFEANQVIPLLSKVYKRTGESKQLFKLTAKAKGLKPRDLAQLKLYQVEAYVDAGNDSKAMALIEELKGLPQGGAYSQLALVYDLILKQDLDSALLQLDTILQQYPSQADSLKLKAVLLLRSQQPEQAAETYQTYLEAHPEDTDTQFLLAQLYSDLKDFGQAEKLADELLIDYPSQPVLLQIKALARANAEDFAAALANAEASLAVNSEDISSRVIAGVSAYKLEKFDVANQHLSLVAGLLPSQHIALRVLADTQLRLGLTMDANDTLTRFEQVTQEDAGLLAGVGLALLQQGEVNKARAALAMQPEHVDDLASKANLAQLKLSLNDETGIVDLEDLLIENRGDQESPLNTEQVEATLAQAYFSTEQFDKAMKIATKWQQSSEPALQAKGYVIAAKINLANNNRSAALEAYKAASSRAPETPGLMLEQIPLQYTERADQLKATEELLAQHPAYLPAIVSHYLTTKLLGVKQTMTEHLSNLITQGQGSEAAKVILAKMWLLEGELDKGIAQLEQVKGQQPKAYWANLAEAYIKAKQGEKAEKLYENWFELQPNSARAVAGMMKVYFINGDADKALALADKYLIELGGRDSEVQLLQLYMLANTQDYTRLAQELPSLPENLQQLPFAQGLKAQLLMHSGKDSEALPLLQNAYRAVPSPQNTQLLYLVTKRLTGSAKANQFLTRHVKDNPKDEASTLALAQLNTYIDTSLAMQQYQAVLSLNPNNFVALNNMANLFMRDGKLQQAYKYAQRALEQRPQEGPVLDTLGAIELKLGKNKDALTHMTKAVELLQDRVDDDVMLNYLEALYRNDQAALAKRRISQYQFKTEKGKSGLEDLRKQYQ